jgi:hypothetical protein
MPSRKPVRRPVVGALLALAALILAPAARAALVISTAATAKVTCSAGSCTATAPDAVLNVVDLKTLLRHGDVRVGSGPADMIALATTLAWTQPSRLTLVAHTTIAVTQPVVVEGAGSVALTTTNDKSAGAIAFTGRGRLDFWSLKDRLIVNDNAYILVNDVSSLVSAIAANPYGYFALARDYDATADAPYTASPIYVLYGALNGLGHAISHLRIASTESCAGFLAYLLGGTAPSVSNLTLAQIDLTHTWNGSFVSPSGVGGLVGCSQGAISRVRVTGRVDGPTGVPVGGIAGWATDNNPGRSPISDSSVSAVVSGDQAGGIAGVDYVSSIVRCAVTGRVTGGTAGGLVGAGFAWITTGNWSSALVIGAVAGGLVGWADGAGLTFADNYATGAVSSGGGLVGKSSDHFTIVRSYARGVVHGGGVTGSDDATGVYTNVYWDMDTTRVRNPGRGVYNIPNEPGITGLTDAQLKSGLPAGFDPAVWAENPAINNGYPYLIANPPQ